MIVDISGTRGGGIFEVKINELQTNSNNKNIKLV